VSNVDQGSLKIEKDDMEFSHPYFVQGKKNLLARIKRKVLSILSTIKAPYRIQTYLSITFITKKQASHIVVYYKS